ncbi:MAG: CHAT domain-containing protein [Coleofasciculus chthonoplastes F3-SA18-01]|uniref:CHAT domain-containing protein n=1 Tax=Coleofasciculus chthonoplastes TaxID=64178 RepID=UPI0032F37DF9
MNNLIVLYHNLKRFIKYGLICLCVTLLIGWGQTYLPRQFALGTEPPQILSQQPIVNINTLVQQGQRYYKNGQFTEAVSLWQEAASQLADEGNQLQQARVLSYLALAFQQLGKWQEAKDAIALSFNQLQSLPDSPDKSLILAQVLNNQGHLQLSLGNAADALKTWEKVHRLYTRLGDETGSIGSLINQAQAQQSLGQLREAFKTLTLATMRLQRQPDSLLKFTAWSHLGELVRVVGNSNPSDPNWLSLKEFFQFNTLTNLEQSKSLLDKSLILAQSLDNTDAIAEAYFQLGNWANDTYHHQRSLYERTRPSLQKIQPVLDAVAQAGDYYQQAITLSNSSLISLQSQLNHLSVLFNTQYWLLKQRHWSNAQTWWQEKVVPQLPNLTQIQANITALPTSHTAIDCQIQFAQLLVTLNQIQQTVSQNQVQVPTIYRHSIWTRLDGLLTATFDKNKQIIQQSHELEDRRSEAYATGISGKLYESTQNLENALELTHQAIQISQSIQAWDIAYQWQWQLGRLRKAQGNIDGELGAIRSERTRSAIRSERTRSAIAAYQAAVNTVNTIRLDLATLNPDVRFSFRDEVEPIYRELIDLLLRDETPSPQNLIQAREVLAQLQLAELENYLQEACASPNPALIDQIVDEHAPNTAVIYTILLDDRLEVMLKLPQCRDVACNVSTPSRSKINPSHSKSGTQPTLQHHRVKLSPRQVEERVDQLRTQLTNPQRTSRYTKAIQNTSQPIYNWLVSPFESQLKANGINTLVFVLDGALQTVPMAVLWDGNQYLIEKYAIALNREPQLLAPVPLSQYPLQTLAFGLSQVRSDFAPHQSFSPLANVEIELSQIPSDVKLLNQAFTSQALQTQINARPFSIVHFATHGQFSSNPNETFILAWDKRIKVNELSHYLKSREESLPDPIELLVLSACQTANGDNRATLGLAGIAVRAGARSTIATLWEVNDKSTTDFIRLLYQQLTNSTEPMSKAEAIQWVQKEFLKNENYKPPYYWAPFVLIGNWLSLFQG